MIWRHPLSTGSGSIANAHLARSSCVFFSVPDHVDDRPALALITTGCVVTFEAPSACSVALATGVMFAGSRPRAGLVLNVVVVAGPRQAVMISGWACTRQRRRGRRLASWCSRAQSRASRDGYDLALERETSPLFADWTLMHTIDGRAAPGVDPDAIRQASC
jgi:hypothetical protein